MRHAKYNIRNTKNGPRVTSHQSRINAGSALILTVVLTSLLAIVGVLFVMMARVNQIASSGLSESRELDAAIETVIAKISEELVLDVPGVSATNPDYYDYPDANNAWLASLEPYQSETDPNEYYWRQISDVTGFLNDKGFPTQNVNVKPVGLSTTVYVRDYPEITLDGSGELKKQSADADGDGVADSKWIELADVTSSKGRPIYAAIRIIDNGGMLNVNTAYMFDPNGSREEVDGSSQMQINLMALAGRPPLPTWPVGNPHTLNDETDLRTARANGVDIDPYLQYQNSVIWSYGEPAPYTPFDVSDELELRYRFLLNHPGIDTRLEDWGGEFRDTVIETPVDSGGLDEWFKRASFNPAILDPSIDSKDPNYYAYRHIATTYNMDRIIDPNGEKMVNVNINPSELDSNSNDFTETTSRNTADWLYRKLTRCIDPNLSVSVQNRMREKFAQLAVNIVDLRDTDTDVTWFDPNDGSGAIYFGLEPHPCITEVAIQIDPCDPTTNPNYYAVELFNPFDANINMTDFQLAVTDSNVLDVDISLGTVVMDPCSYYVIYNAPRFLIGGQQRQEPALILSSGYKVDYNPITGQVIVDPNIVNAWNVAVKRKVWDVNSLDKYIYVDRQIIYKNWVKWDPSGSDRYYKQDFDLEDCPWWYVVYPSMSKGVGTLGSNNKPGQTPIKPGIDISLPYNSNTDLVTVGDISRIWTVGPRDELDAPPYDPNEPNEPGGIYDSGLLDPNDPNGGIYVSYRPYLRTVGEKLRFAATRFDLEELVRIDVSDPYYQNLFQYITVLDPAAYPWNDPDETRIKGRVNINTAPWYVIAQLPWVSQREDGYNDELARAIAGYRDASAFESIGQLMRVTDANSFDHSIDYYWGDDDDITGFPDLTWGDGAADDFEERDVIFSRISNLVTVRSDVFTAYILVRIGTDGPQKRVIAIFDRSDVYLASGNVKVRALQPVADPR